MKSRDLFYQYVKEIEEASLPGGDFSSLTRHGRMVEAPLPWNYFNLLTPCLLEAETLLDMGTGGGEFPAQQSPAPRRPSPQNRILQIFK